MLDIIGFWTSERRFRTADRGEIITFNPNGKGFHLWYTLRFRRNPLVVALIRGMWAQGA